MSLPKIIAVVGTTASGKSDMALDLAKKFNGEVISADSRQIYKEMDIGTNKEPGKLVHTERNDVKHWVFDEYEDKLEQMSSPLSLQEAVESVYEVDGIPHYMMSVVSPADVLTLAHFQTLAFGIIEDIIQRGKTPILVGGTSLYTSAILENWQIPEVEPDKELRNELDRLSDVELIRYLDAVDSKSTKKIDLTNRRRMIRAIEIAVQGRMNKSLNKLDPKYQPLYLAPTIDREEVYDRINQRVDKMVELGLVEEVKAVGEKYGYDVVAMTGHAYQQIGKYLQGEWSLEQALEESKKVTRHYAKRQLTWWRKHGDVRWCELGEAQKLTKEFLHHKS